MPIEIEHTLQFSLPPGTVHAMMHMLMTPVSGQTQVVESWSVEIAGIGNAGRFRDAYGNQVHLVNQGRAEGELVAVARGVVRTIDTHGVVGRPGGEPVPALYKRVTPLTKAPAGLAGKFRGWKGSRLDLLHALMARVGEMLGVDEAPAPAQTQMQATGEQVQSQETEPAALPPAADYAHLFIGAARALDVPTRFVTGYLCDAGVHAWAEAYDEGLGWIGFDPRLQLCPTERHVRLAVGLDAESARPLRVVPAVDVVETAVVRAV
jgi:hypothetical protein